MTTHGTEIKPKGLTRAHLVRGRIPNDYWSTDFNNYEGPADARDSVREYLRDLEVNKRAGRGLLLAGKVGTGKTSLLVILLKYLMRANWACTMTSLSELVESIQRSWKSHDHDEEKYVAQCRNEFDFLGIDDLGKEHIGPTGFAAVTFDNILRHRMQHRLPTFFTTNLDRKEIKSRYGDSTLSLIEGKTKIIPVNGSDYRQSVLKNAIR